MKIAIYVFREYAKSAPKNDSYEGRLFPGIEIVKSAMEKAGLTVEYCDKTTAHKYQIVLVSIIASCDVWTYIGERMEWSKSNKPFVVVGGPGVMNVRGYLDCFDAAVFGRGEDVIVPLIKSVESGSRMEDLSVCYADEFSVDKRYEYKQAIRPWGKYKLANGRDADENMIGCYRRCLFCNYTWSRRWSQTEWNQGKSIWGVSKEMTFFDIDVNNPETMKDFSVVGLDGYSERLRFMVGKGITRVMWRSFVQNLSSSGNQYAKRMVKVFNMCGLPTETTTDVDEMREDATLGGEAAKPNPDGRVSLIALWFTPFEAIPGTPSAIWPMKYFQYTERDLTGNATSPGNVYSGNHVSVKLLPGSAKSLYSVFLNAIIQRAEEQHSDSIRKIAMSGKFWSAPSDVKRLTLEKYFNPESFFKGHTWESLPSRYLHSYIGDECVRALSENAEKFKDGIPVKYAPVIERYNKGGKLLLK